MNNVSQCDSNPYLSSFRFFKLFWQKCPLERENYQIEYVYPVDDDTVIPLPFVTLRGKLIRHTFPGVPNYENISEGDIPEPRWVLEISKSEIRRLIGSKYISKELYDDSEEGWIQLIPVGLKQNPQSFLNRQVIVKGYLGTLASHIHTPVTIEAKEMYDGPQ